MPKRTGYEWKWGDNAHNNQYGGDTNAPTGGGGNPTGNPSQQLAFGPDGKFNAYVDGYAYQVSLDSEGKASGVTQTGQPPVTDAEALKLFREGKYFKTREEMLPHVQEERNICFL